MIFTDVPQDGYQRVIHVEDDVTGLDAYIALHSTKLGPAIGGIRLYAYEDRQQQLTDALRLSKGMTFKNAAAGLDHGGAKTTVNLNKIKDRNAAFQILGKAVNLLDGAYICAGDVGTTTDDLYRVNDGTSYVAGIKLDSSKPTALGVYTSIEALLDFNGKRVNQTSFTIEGMGKVGKKLADCLMAQGGDVRAYDPYDAVFKEYDNSQFNITQLSAAHVLDDDSDMYVPCALGATLNMRSLNTMTQRFVCGSANNQFATPNDIAIAHNLGIQYVPDFIANCGGVVAVAYDFKRQNANTFLTTTLRQRIIDMLAEAKHEDMPVQIIAEQIANRRLN
jgi:leucine dehydrogenase